jgi:hypothetical protein
MNGKKRANTRKSGVRRDKNGKWMEGTPSPNPAGRPSLGESYREIFASTGNLTIKELRERYPTYDRFDNVADDVKLKELVSLSVLVTLACEPSPGMLATLLDRTDGPLEHTINLNKLKDDELATAIQPILEKLGIRLEPPNATWLENNTNNAATDMACGVPQP